jgi:hypothetical protein
VATYTERLLLLIDAKTGGAVAPLKQMEAQAKKTETAWDRSAKSIGISAQTLRAGLVAGATALVGTGLVEFLGRTAGAYADAALAANQMSRATNASVEDASRFVAVASRYGLGLSDLTEIFADLQQAVGEGKVNLEEIGVVLAKNKDGTTDWITTGVQLIDTINKLPDATQRMKLMFAAFGEEGAKQLMTLAASGKTVEDQMRAIETAQIFDTKDVAAAQRYNEAMQGLGSAFKDVQLALGQTLAPIVAGLTTALVPLINLLGQVPTELYLIVGAAIAVRSALKSAFVTSAISNLATALTGLKGATSGAGAGLASLAKSAGPTMLLIGAITAVTKALQNTASIKAAATDIDNTTLSLRAQAEQLVKTDSVWNTFLVGNDVDRAMGQITNQTENAARAALDSAESTDAQKKAAQSLLDVLGDGTQEQKTNNLATEEGRQAQEDFALSLSASEKAAADTAKAQKSLADMIAAGGSTYTELSAAALEAATAQEKQAAATQLASDMMDAAVVTTEELVTATLALFDADIAHERALIKRREAVADAVALLKDEEATRDDLAESILAVREASLAAAQSYVEERMAAREAAGEFVTEAEKRTMLIESLERQLASIPKSLPAARTSLQTLIDKLKEDTELGPITIDGIQFKEGTTEEQVKALQSRISAAFAIGNQALAVELQAELNKLKLDVPKINATVDFVDADGKPVETPTFPVKVSTPDLDATKTALDSLTGDREAKINAVVYNEQNSRNVLDGLVGDREAKINAVVHNAKNTENVLNGLDDDRHVYFYVHVVGADTARATLETVQPSRMGTLLTPPQPATTGAAPSGPAAGGRLVTFSPTVINHYPAPERASDSIAASLRVARHMLGAGL